MSDTLRAAAALAEALRRIDGWSLVPTAERDALAARVERLTEAASRVIVEMDIVRGRPGLRTRAYSALDALRAVVLAQPTAPPVCADPECGHELMLHSTVVSPGIPACYGPDARYPCPCTGWQEPPR